MAKLPVISGAAAVRVFERAAWRRDRQKGSHVVMLKKGEIASLSVPQHRELAPGTLRAPSTPRSQACQLDHFQSAGRLTRPARKGFLWI
jgi:predicted RNA binding protein YcfA (HicA-like mRNA interferase family)